MVREHLRESSYIPFLICGKFLCQTKRQRLIHDKNFNADKIKGCTKINADGSMRFDPFRVPLNVSPW
jgi:hypothetical protein